MGHGLLVASAVCGVLVYAIAACLPDLMAPRGATAHIGSEARRWWRSPRGSLAIALPFLGFLFTLPTKAPLFSTGQDLGRGFLIGGVGALLSAGIVYSERRSWCKSEASMGAGITCVAAALLLLRGSVIDALAGVMIGWFCVLFVLSQTSDADVDPLDRTSTLATSSGIMATLGVCSALGLWRDALTPDMERGLWSAAMLAFVSLSAVLLTAVRLALRGPIATIPQTVRVLAPLALAVTGGAASMKLLVAKTGLDPHLLDATLIGFVAYLVMGWLLRSGSDSAPTFRVSAGSGPPALAVLVALGGFTAAYQTLHGVGAGVCVLAMWICSLANRGRNSEIEWSETRLLLFATTLVLGSAFQARYADDLSGVGLSDQYALFGLIVGAMIPGCIAVYTARPAAPTWVNLLPTISACALVLGSPALVILLFGAKCTLALFIGLALGSSIVVVPGMRPAGGCYLPHPCLPGMIAIACALALFQFGGPAFPLGDIMRLHKVEVIGAVSSACIVLVVCVSIITRRLRRQPEQPSEARSLGEV